MTEPQDALILSAGWGTRLRPLTFYRPKVLTPFKGKPLLQRWIHILGKCGVKRIFVNFHALPAHFKHFLQFLDTPSHVELLPVFEKSILGSGGSVLNIIKNFASKSLIIVNGDTVIDWKHNSLHSFLKKWNGGIKLALTYHPLYNNIVLDPEGKILRFRSKPTNHEQKQGFQCMAFMGIHILENNILNDIKWNGEFVDIIELYKSKLHQNCISYECFSNIKWYDIGTPRLYFNSHFDGKCNDYYTGSDSMVDSKAQIEQCIIWDEVLIKGSSRLKSCIVLDGMTVSGKMENCIITRHGCYKL